MLTSTVDHIEQEFDFERVECVRLRVGAGCVMRGYGEVVDVLTDEVGQPSAFVWRGRRYRVTSLLQTWREIVPWWREAAVMELVGPGAEGERPPLARERLELDRRLWRVEAAPGQAVHRGVFDLASTARGWSLERLGD